MPTGQAVFWDPFDPILDAARRPTRAALRRIQKDLQSLRRDPIDGIFCFPDEQKAARVHGLVTGPMGTPYECGFFYFVLECPDDYPQNPPRVKHMTNGGGRVRLNPSLCADGSVILSTLDTCAGPGWVPVNTLGSVLLSIRSLLSERPLANEPEFVKTAKEADVTDYNDAIAHETIRIAVLDMVGNTPMHASLPKPIQQLVRKLFFEHYDKYLTRVEANLARNGQVMRDILDRRRGCFQWVALQQELAATKALVQARQCEPDRGDQGVETDEALKEQDADALESSGEGFPQSPRRTEGKEKGCFTLPMTVFHSGRTPTDLKLPKLGQTANRKAPRVFPLP